MPSDRTAILIRCTREDAERIRRAAVRERRTISGYVINAVMSRMESRDRALAAWEKKLQKEEPE